MLFFVKMEETSLLSTGIYTVPNASRLSRVSSRRIRYWLKDIQVEKQTEKVDARLWKGQLSPIDHVLALGFYDLQEIRLVDAFLKAGVPWKTLRLAHNVARERYKTEHPFCKRNFATDGKYVLEKLGTYDEQVEEVIRGQKEFPKIVETFFKNLEFSENDELLRWWPLGKKHSVVLDPKRQFGQPIIAKYGIQTEVLSSAVKAGQSVKDVAFWYEIDLHSVNEAVHFEEWLLA